MAKNKNLQYFSHDIYASQDSKIQDLMMEMGTSGYGIYWILIESLYKNFGKLEHSARNRICHFYKIDKDDLDKVIENYGLFVITETEFFSEGVLERIVMIQQRSDEGKKNIRKRFPITENNRTPITENNRTPNRIRGRETKLNKTKLNNPEQNDTTKPNDLQNVKPHVKQFDSLSDLYEDL
jgi:hypothetical protein